MSDQPEDETQDTLRWFTITHTPEWDQTIQAYAQNQFMANTAIGMNRKASEPDREAARCRNEVWGEIIGWAAKYETAFNEMKAEQAAAARRESDDLVGPTVEEQWYAK